MNVLPAPLHNHLVHSRFVCQPLEWIFANQPRMVSSSGVGLLVHHTNHLLSIGSLINSTEPSKKNLRKIVTLMLMTLKQGGKKGGVGAITFSVHTADANL